MRFRRDREPAPPAAPTSGVDVDAFADAVHPERLDVDQFVRLVDVLDVLGRAGTGIELAGMRTETFVRFVSRASTAQLEALMAHPHLRQVILDEVFRRMAGHLSPDRAATVAAVVHWRFTGGADEDGYDRFETVLSGGTCRSGRHPTADARVTLTLSPVDFLRVVTGEVAVPLLFLRGRVKVRGDIAFAAGLVGYFDLPRP